MIDPPQKIARRLRGLRLELGFKTQTAFADEIGIDKSTYNLFETGKRSLTFETALMIRAKWGITIDWLFFGDLGPAAQNIMVKLGRFPGPGAPEAPEQAPRRRKVAS